MNLGGKRRESAFNMGGIAEIADNFVPVHGKFVGFLILEDI